MSCFLQFLVLLEYKLGKKGNERGLVIRETGEGDKGMRTWKIIAGGGKGELGDWLSVGIQGKAGR